MKTTTAALVKQLKGCRDIIAGIRDVSNLNELTDSAEYLDKVTSRISTAIRKLKNEDHKNYANNRRP